MENLNNNPLVFESGFYGLWFDEWFTRKAFKDSEVIDSINYL